MPEESIERVRAQFGRSASDYAESAFFAGGEDLHYLLELTRPEEHWNALDVATGAGHTALAFASRVHSVIATDVTREMLAETEALARRKGLTNLKTRVADACNLPFPGNAFDLVTCRLGAHHFHDFRAAMEGCARVLRPGGVLGFADNITVEDAY